MTKTTPLFERARARQLKFLGHIFLLLLEEPCWEYDLYVPEHGKKKSWKAENSVPKLHSMSTGGSECHARPTTAVSYHTVVAGESLKSPALLPNNDNDNDDDDDDDSNNILSLLSYNSYLS